MSTDARDRVIPLGSRGAAPEDLLAVARRAQRAWREAAVRRRLDVVASFRHRLAAEAGTLARAIGRRPASESLTGEVLPLLACCRHLERHAVRVLGPRRSRGRFGIWLAGIDVEVTREPFGTVLIVAPSNYPVMLAGVQALQALVAGNAVIVKPAPGTRTPIERLAEMLDASGLPDGLMQVTDESVAAAEALLAMPVDKLVFTGSTDSGRAVLARASDTLVPAAAELSGWDACLVLDEADCERAAAAVTLAVRFNSGRTCLAPRRVIVTAAGYDRFVAALERRLARIASIALDAELAARVAELAREAEHGGARRLSGAAETAQAAGPVVLADVDPSMRIFGAELFGPVALVTRAPTDDDAIRIAGMTRFGLGASIFGPPRAARTVADRLECGVVTINDAVVPAGHPDLPLAPRRESGFGVTRGREGLLAMTRPKAIAVNRARRPLHLAGRDPPAALVQAYIEAAHGRGLTARARAALAASRALVGYLREERTSCR